VKSDSPKLEPLRQAMDPNHPAYTGKPIEWVQLHKVPDYSHFSHQAHVNRGVSCVECHGRIDEMPVVYHAKPLSMSWCLECHRDPAKVLRPLDQITNLAWKSEDLDAEKFYAYVSGKTKTPVDQLKKSDEGKVWNRELIGAHLQKAWAVHPPQDCAACHH
jgi:hypothetical protein